MRWSAKAKGRTTQPLLLCHMHGEMFTPHRRCCSWCGATVFDVGVGKGGSRTTRGFSPQHRPPFRQRVFKIFCACRDVKEETIMSNWANYFLLFILFKKATSMNENVIEPQKKLYYGRKNMAQKKRSTVIAHCLGIIYLHSFHLLLAWRTLVERPIFVDRTGVVMVVEKVFILFKATTKAVLADDVLHVWLDM